MPEPPANDPVDPDAIAGGSDTEAARASRVIRWISIAAILALGLFYALVVAAEELSGKVIRVADGDTLTLRTAQPLDYQVRIAGIDAPEKRQPFGTKSRESLSSMVAGRNVTVIWHKRDQYGRLVAQVFADSHDVGLIQIERGLAWHYKAYEREQTTEDAQGYAEAEEAARLARRGLWADREPVPPWEYRQAGQSK